MFADIMKVFILQTTINKAISNDLRKRLNARVLARFGHFAHIMCTR